MLRTAIIRTAASASTRLAAAAARPASAGAFRSANIVARAGAAVPRWPAAAALQTVRMYSAGSGLEKQEVEQRIFGILRNFDKVGASLLAQFALELVLVRIAVFVVGGGVRFVLLCCDAMRCDALHYMGGSRGGQWVYTPSRRRRAVCAVAS